jgi:diacylglycerol kinase (ATP)
MTEKVMAQFPQAAGLPQVTPSAITPPATSRRAAYRVAPTLWSSVRYAAAGLQYAFMTQRNFRIHTVIGTFALSLGIGLRLSAVELTVICLTSALVMSLELLNTAIESVVDLTVGRTYHELAKIAKDCAAGAVLVAAIFAVLVALFLLVPPIWQLLQGVLFYSPSL